MVDDDVHVRGLLVRRFVFCRARLFDELAEIAACATMIKARSTSLIRSLMVFALLLLAIQSAKAGASHLDWLAGIGAFKAVVLEGLEVVFIVIAVGAGNGLLVPASLGALAACVVVLAVGAAIHKPLASVPENGLKYAVGIMLSAFGVFWAGEGLGVAWPGRDFAILGFALLFLLVGLTLGALARRSPLEIVR